VKSDIEIRVVVFEITYFY